MLHHGDITLWGILFKFSFALFDVSELNFLVLFGLCVNRRAGEG